MNDSRIALVTGGSRGLGRDMALNLAREGHDLIVTYHRDAGAAAQVKQDVEALGRSARVLPLDVADVASFPAFAREVESLLKTQWGRSRFDVLVNNGGFNGQGTLGSTLEKVFDDLANVHFKGVYFLTQQLLPQLADGGSIVCISSGLTRTTIPGYAPYAAMKAAVETLVRYWAKELGPRRIRVNALAPGAIATDFSRQVYEAHPELPVMVAQNTALGRIGEAGDIGPVAAFLCSPRAGWINAQRIEVSGGQML